MSDKFQPDFYVTCATVIPVLFLAVAVQGRLYQSVVARGLAFMKQYRRSSVNRTRPIWVRSGMAFASLLLANVATAIVIAGGLGEFFALYALYRGSEQRDGRASVFVLTLVLVAAVVAGPLWAILRSPHEARAPVRQVPSGKDEGTETQRGGHAQAGGDPVAQPDCAADEP